MRKSRPQGEILRTNRLSLPTLLDTSSPVLPCKPRESPYFPPLSKPIFPLESRLSPHQSPWPAKYQDSSSRRLLNASKSLSQEHDLKLGLNCSADNALLHASPSDEMRLNKRHKLLFPLKTSGDSMGSLEISLMKVPLRAREKHFPRFLKQRRTRKTYKSQGISTDNPDYRSSSPLLIHTDDATRLPAERGLPRHVKAKSAWLQSLQHMVSEQQHSKGLGQRFASVVGTTQRGGILPTVERRKGWEGVKSHTLLNR